jgi:flagellar hook protein FlgE
MNAAIGGMSAQSAALGSISDNIANSQTTGFKETDTAFIDYVTGASATSHSPGAVVALPQYTNAQQGAITQVSNPTSLAVTGAGFFAVQLPTGPNSFSAQPYYTRVGDFAPNSAGNLVNSTGYVLDGWPASNAAGTQFNSTAAGPIQISKSPSAPVPTSEIALTANLPATPPAGTTSYNTTAQVFDAGGNAQNVNLAWSQVPTTAPGPVASDNPAVPNEWNLTVTAGASTTGPMLVNFGVTAADAGTITGITQAAGDPAGTVPAIQASGSPAQINLALDFGLGKQPVTLNLGQFGTPAGITQFSGTSYQVASQTQDGSAQGNYTSVTIKPTGDVVINYDNGATSTIARIPLVNFNNPDALQQQSGQAFTATTDSGNPNVVAAGTGGTGTLTVGAVEASNVDIATQFTQMIVAQRAYTANSKVVTTANALMQDTLNMIQG